MKRWLVEIFNSKAKCIGIGKFSSLSRAMESAQGILCEGRHARITNRITNKLKMRYWYDKGLQYISY